jgi:uncharacterized protein (DUF433 family)
VSTAIAYAHIVQSPGIAGGRPRIDGHRIRVQDIAVEHESQAPSAEEICHQHGGLTLAEVYSALAYFHDHRDAILADLEADRRAVEAFEKAHPEYVGSSVGFSIVVRSLCVVAIELRSHCT